MVRTVSVPTPTPVHDLAIVLDDRDSAAPPHHAVHSVSCLLVFTALFLLLFLLVRACCLVCCFGGGVAQRRVVVVPPEHAIIRTIEPHPMLATERLDAKAVQVAEPFKA